MTHMLKRLFIYTLLGWAFTSNAQNSAQPIEQFSGINKLTFHDASFNKKFVGNGFLINYNNKLYAVTVKHALLEAKTPEMTGVSIEGIISDWTIHPNNNPQQYVKLGKLLNADSSEAIDMKVLQNDWLVFEVVDNQSNLAILTLRQQPLVVGEEVTAFGCSYANQDSCVQDSYHGTFISAESNNLRIAMPDLALNKLRGLSGSPVLDKHNQVVGIVSNVMKSKSSEGFDFAPANLNYLHKVLARL